MKHILWAISYTSMLVNFDVIILSIFLLPQFYMVPSYSHNYHLNMSLKDVTYRHQRQRSSNEVSSHPLSDAFAKLTSFFLYMYVYLFCTAHICNLYSTSISFFFFFTVWLQTLDNAIHMSHSHFVLYMQMKCYSVSHSFLCKLDHSHIF